MKLFAIAITYIKNGERYINSAWTKTDSKAKAIGQAIIDLQEAAKDPQSELFGGTNFTVAVEEIPQHAIDSLSSKPV